MAAGLERLIALTPSGDVVDPWDVPSGWRPHGRAWATWRVRCGDAPHVDVAVRGTADDASVRLGGAEPVAAAARLEGERLVVTVGGDVRHYLVARDGDVRWFGHDGEAWALVEQEQLSADRSRASGGAGPVRSPMPGAVIAVGASVGDQVVTGQPLVTVEAMKMEHTLTAPVDGTLVELHVRVGQQVRMDEVVAVVAEEERS